MWGRKSSASANSARPAKGGVNLAERRRLQRRRVTVFFAALAVVLVACFIWLTWREGLRIHDITMYGVDQSLADMARTQMQGSYLGIVPKDSAFFYPAGAIRRALMQGHPEYAAISIFREGATGLSIKVSDRVPIARWCGLAPTAGVEAYCYLFDASGYIYAADATSTLQKPLNSFDVYDPLAGDVKEPLGATLAQAARLPSTFDLARAVGSLASSTASSTVSAVVIRGDEVDDLLASGTRITYLLGGEQEAFSALDSSTEQLDLSSGTIEYIDVRFPSKIYLKRK